MKKAILLFPVLLFPLAVFASQPLETDKSFDGIDLEVFLSEFSRTERTKVRSIPSAPNYRFAFDLGYSGRFGRVAPVSDNSGIRDMYDESRGGLNYGTDFHGFILPNLGLGLKFSGGHYKGKSGTAAGKLKVNTVFFGPSLMFRKFGPNGKNAVVISYSFGYSYYKEKRTLSKKDVMTNSKGDFKNILELGYDFRLAKNVFLGPKVSVSLGHVNIETSPGLQYYCRNIGSFDAGVGIRF